MAGRPRSVRNVIVFGLMPQVLFIVASTRAPLPLEWFYAILFLILTAQVFYFERDNPGVRAVDTRQYKVAQAKPQLIAGASVGVVLGLPSVIWGEPSIGTSLLSDIVTQAIFVSFVETYYLIVFIETLSLGKLYVVLLWVAVFGFLHVRTDVLAGVGDLTTVLRFTYAATFGALFWLLYAGRTLFPKPRNKYFGGVTSWTAHFILNMIVIAFQLTLWGLVMFPV